MIGVTGQELAIGVTADLLLGDPRWLPHPIVAVGNLAKASERRWRVLALPLRLAGVGAWCSVIGVACGFVYLTTKLLPAPFVQVYWIYSFLALRSLDQHAMAVVSPLRDGDLQEARKAVGLMVGRDTGQLDERDIARAVIETVAENLSDGVIAPLFWLAAGGPVAMAAYKVINTLDSMFGYKNDRYLEFGWWSARVDDWANWIPARITAALIWMVSFAWPGMRFRESVRVTFRDAHKQPSPNSGYPEAAAAGALGVQLGGASSYRGVRSVKAFLGDNVAGLNWGTYWPMRVLLYGSSLLFTAMLLGVATWR